jgi:hypothetical protein
MAAAREVIKKCALILLVLLPAIGAGIWSALPTIMTLMAMVTLNLPKFDMAQIERPETNEQILSMIQNHFLQSDIYIPLDEIWLVQSGRGVEADRHSLLMREACGHGTLYVWIPFKLRLPIVGTKTMEWCWKPELKLTRANG